MNDQRYQTAAVAGFHQRWDSSSSCSSSSPSSWWWRTAGRSAQSSSRGFFLILAGMLSFYVLFMLRRLLWDRYDFHKLDVIIPVLAVADVVLEILNQFTEVAQVTSPADAGRIVAARILFIIVPWGIINIVFAAGLLKLHFSEKSLLRPFAYLYLAARDRSHFHGPGPGLPGLRPLPLPLPPHDRRRVGHPAGPDVPSVPGNGAG